MNEFIKILDNAISASKEFLNYITNKSMLHSVYLTAQELSAVSGFLILKDDGNFSEKDYVVVTVKEEATQTPYKTEAGEERIRTSPERLTKSQVFFIVTSVQTSDNTRGIRKGYAMVKIKRSKNPIPKVEETEAEAEA